MGQNARAGLFARGFVVARTRSRAVIATHLLLALRRSAIRPLGLPKSRRGLPYGVVEVGRGLTDGAVKLSGDEARLALHEGGAGQPRLEERLFVRLSSVTVGLAGGRVHV